MLESSTTAELPLWVAPAMLPIVSGLISTDWPAWSVRLGGLGGIGGRAGKPGKVVGEGLGFGIGGYPWVGEFNVVKFAVTLRFAFMVT
jgi:hypothetical protein